MKETLKFSSTKEKLTIEINPSMKPIVKLGLAFQGLLITAFSIGFVLFILYQVSEIGIATFAFMGFGIVYFIVGRKYLRRVFCKEIIEITTHEITIIDKYLTTKATRSFLISEISNISFAGQHSYTRHPLAGESTDYTGFGVSEQGIQYLIADGTIEIFCNGGTRRFGKNIASWDAEEIVSRIEKFTGKNFRLDNKTEQLLDELDDFENKNNDKNQKSG